MSEGMYSALALIPESSDFSLEAALSHFASVSYPKFTLRTELAAAPGAQLPGGFRVIYPVNPDWSIVSWLETGPDVLAESVEMAQEAHLPAPAEVIAACSRRLSVWSDEDPDQDWAHLFEEYLEELRGRFGVYVKDNVLGGWRA